MEAKVSILFGNYFQNGNHFHSIWKHIFKMEMVSILFGYSFQMIRKLSLDWHPNQMETVSKKRIQFPNQLDTCCHYGYFLRVSILD